MEKEVTIKVTSCLDDGIAFDLFVDGKEHTHASIGTWNEETYKHMCNLMGVSVFGLLSNSEYAAQHKMHPTGGTLRQSRASKRKAKAAKSVGSPTSG